MKKIKHIFFLFCTMFFIGLTVTACAEDAVVYVKDGGTGNGTSASSPLGDIADAFTALPNGGTIVLCGDYTLARSSLFCEGSPSVFTAPTVGGAVTVTAAYKNTDYGAKLICEGSMRYYCSEDTVFENITLYTEPNKTLVIAGRFFDLTFGDGCVTENAELHVVGGMDHIDATVSVPGDDYSKDAHVTVRSGRIAELTGLGRNVGKSGGKANYTGTAYITIGGDAVVERLFGAYRWGTKTVTGGNVDLTLDGGKITNYFTGCGSETVDYTCNVTVHITGNMQPDAYFNAVTPGRASNGAFLGLNAGGLYSTATNSGKTALDLENAPQISAEWIETFVNIESFDSITGYTQKEKEAVTFVYLSDKGDDKNDGQSENSPVRTITQALKTLSDDGGTIIVCGTVTISGENASSFPSHTNTVTITSVFDGSDFTNDGAKLVFSNDLFLGGPTVLRQIKLQARSGAAIFCRGNDLTVGEDVNTNTSQKPIAIWGGTDASRSDASASSMCYYDYTIQIDSGIWSYVRGGSLRSGEGQAVGTIGDVSIIINGGSFTSTATAKSETGVIAVAGFDALDGNANITVNGGTFNCSIMGIGRPGYNSTVSNNAYAYGDISITVNGGTFGSGTVIGAVHDTVASELHGNFALTVSGGSFHAAFGGFSAESVLGDKTLSLAETVSAKQVGFDKAIYVSDSGSDQNRGDTAKTAMQTISAAAKALGDEGGIIVICGKVSAGTDTLSAYSGKLRITSLANGVDYTEKGACLTVNGTLTFGGETVLENLVLAGSGTLSAGGYDLTVGENVSGGKLSVSGGTGNATHTVTIESGSFAAVEGSSTAAVIIRGGTVTKVSGNMVSIAGGNIGNAQDYTVTAQKNVVYVKDGGTGDGSTPDQALGDIADAAAALNGDGTIVVCGKLTLLTGKSLQAKGGKLTLTSAYGGVDYRITDGANILLTKHICFTSDAEIRDLDICVKANGTYISAEGNVFTVGEGVNCSIFRGNRTEDYPDLIAGSVSLSPSLGKDIRMTVHSGTWGSLSGGQFSPTESASAKRITGNIAVDVYGGTFTDNCYIVGQNSLTGNAVLNVYGGTFACTVYGMPEDKVTVQGDVTLNAYGGSFEGDIRASQNDASALNGSYTLNLYGSDITRVTVIEGTEDLGGENTSAINTAENLDLSQALSGSISYTNPIAGFADPSIVYADGYYYYTYTKTYNGKAALYMAKAANLCDIGKVEPQLIWSHALSGEASEMTALWAPQLYFLDGRWYIYAAVQTSKDAATGADNRLPYVWVGQADDPMGEYKLFGCMDNVDTDAYTYLSPRIIEHGGKYYMFCSGFYSKSDTDPHIQRMRVCELETPTKMKSKQIVISSPKYAYEAGIMEGPYPFYAPDGTLYMIFAAGHTRGDEYCTGIMRFNGSETDSLLDASKWEKFSEPLQFVDYASGVYSPGAMVVTTSPDGSKYYGVYHAKEYHYSAYTMRRMYMQEITFDTNGFPTMEAPQSVDTVFTVPINALPISGRIVGFDASGRLPAYTEGRLTASRTYSDSFTDVAATDWYYPYVKAAYEYCLVNGISDTKFSPDGKFTVAQALTAVANLHSIRGSKQVRAANGGEKWYAPYVDYCLENNIITAAQFADYERNITRGEMAMVFANVMPESTSFTGAAKTAPDVTADMLCAPAVQKLYTAGIVSGDAGTGNYRPADEIIRSEACVVFTRIAEADADTGGKTV